MSDLITISGGGGGVGGIDLTASGSGWFWCQTVFKPAGPDLAGSGAEGTANVVYAWKTFVPFKITIRTIKAQMAAATAGGTFDVGLYDANGNLLINAGGFTTNSTAVQSASPTPVTITPAVYLFGMCGSLSSLNYQAISQSGNSSRDGGYYVCGNAGSSGILPATLGSLVQHNDTGVYPVATVFAS